MPGFDGTGPRGMGPMTGGGRGFCSPFGMRNVWQPYRTRYWEPQEFPDYRAYGFQHFTPRINREQEIEYLKNEAEALRNELKELEKEIEELTAEKK